MAESLQMEQADARKSHESDIKHGSADTRPPSTEAEKETSAALEETSSSKDEATSALPHVSDRLPWAAWMVVFFSSAERFSYFAFTGPLRKCAGFSLSHNRQLM